MPWLDKAQLAGTAPQPTATSDVLQERGEREEREERKERGGR